MGEWKPSAAWGVGGDGGWWQVLPPPSRSRQLLHLPPPTPPAVLNMMMWDHPDGLRRSSRALLLFITRSLFTFSDL